MSRAFSHPDRNRTHLSLVHSIRTLALASAMAFLGACRDVTEPTVDRAMVPGGEPSYYRSDAAAPWLGRTVSIESGQRNSAGQAVCLDVPWGVAFSSQDVNYFPCHYGPAQQFVLTAWDVGGGQSVAMIRPVSNAAVCLDIRGGTKNGGEHLQLFTCKALNDPSAGNQLFFLPPVLGPLGVPVTSTICVSAGYPSFALEVPLPAVASSFVQQSRRNNGNNQLWAFRDVRSGNYFGSATGATWNRC